MSSKRRKNKNHAKEQAKGEGNPIPDATSDKQGVETSGVEVMSPVPTVDAEKHSSYRVNVGDARVSIHIPISYEESQSKR